MDHKDRKRRTLNADLTIDAVWSPPYDIPEVDPLEELDTEDLRMVTVFRMNQEKHPEECILNFFADDYIFERIWLQPKKYTESLKRFAAVVMPDYSEYWDWPKALNIYNHWRNHTLARFWQDSGITVIPAPGWTTKADYDWCFTGDPKNSIVAVSTVGVTRNKGNTERFNQGYAEMVKRLAPKRVLLYGTDVRTEANKQAVPATLFPSEQQVRRKDQEN